MLKHFYYALHRLFDDYFPTFHKAVFRNKKIVKFVIAGGSATVANIITLFILTDFLKVWYLVSAVIAFLFGVLVSFSLQKFWTFEDQSIQSIKKQFPLYLICAVSGLFLNTLLVYFFVEHISLWYVTAQIISSLIIAVFNFFFFQHVVFKKRIN